MTARRRGSPVRDALAYAPIAATIAGSNLIGPDAAVRTGGALGRAIARLGFPRRNVALQHLRLAFPERSEAERRSILIDHIEHLGRGVAELAMLQGRHRAELLGRVRVEGWDNLREAEARTSSGGVIVFTAHLGTWDLGAAAMAQQGVPISVVHRGFGNSRLEAMMSAVRGPGVEELRMGRSVLGALRALRAGRKLVLLLDQNAHRDEGVFVPFFGHSACTRPGPALIAMRWGFPVVPAFIRRDSDGRGHVIRIGPALELVDLDDDAADDALIANVTQMTRVIEGAIRESPAQWLWLHRRWRTQPLVDVPAPSPS